MSTELPPIERLQALRLEPGDSLVVTLPDRYQPEAEHLDEWRQAFREALGDHRVIFIQGGLELSVIKADA